MVNLKKMNVFELQTIMFDVVSDGASKYYSSMASMMVITILPNLVNSEQLLFTLIMIFAV